MLKIFTQPPKAPAGTSEQYVFSFTARANARPEADAIKDALSVAIQAAKSGSEAPGTAEGVSAAMAMANAVSAGTGRNSWDDDNRLRADAELQQSLLKSNPNLQRMFMESLNSKPETLSGAQFMSQFWSTRLHLLRAHAIERAQMRGSYNVLSTLRPRVEDNVTKLNISKEQIQLIFSQHPLIKRVYDENVPKLSEQQFWSRFFQSRLFKKMRGERIAENDPTDAVLDKYLKADEPTDRRRDTHVPHFMNLAENEMNNSQRLGNRPDLDMRPSGLDKVPIIRTLNNLSEKIMANVAPADRDPTAPLGADEDTFNQLQLRDLQGDEEQNRMILNIRDQNRFFSQAKSEDEQSRLFVKQDPEQILTNLRAEIGRNLPENGTTELRRLVEPDEDDDDETKPTLQAGSKAALHAAFTDILYAIRERRTQAGRSSTTDTYGLSAELYDRLTLTHATSTEFLHQFWQAFLSGNADRAGEVASLAESLSRALDRIKSVAADAETERQVQVEQRRNEAREKARNVPKEKRGKLRVNLEGISGGTRTVNQLLGPTSRALELALMKYKTALAEEMKEMPPLT